MNADGDGARPSHPCVAAIQDVAMAGLRPVREKLLPQAEGDVLEIGVGTGTNFGLYSSRVRTLTGCEPDPHMLKRARARPPSPDHERALDDAFAERLPYPDARFDTVVATFVLCTIPDPAAALAEARRVLRPGGRLLFAEHVAHGHRVGRSMQRAIGRPWGWVAGGCRLDRDALALIRAAGFHDVEHRTHGPQRWTLTLIVSGLAR